ncbi:MAG: hypothetical protein D6753_00320 [Planctomycetota bacterium]|nr:MAG: hypothetical protein D6753_00320 [Planctomycetota bacterium]
MAMRVETSRFGTVETTEDAVLTFPHGLIGFESMRQWVLVPDPHNPMVAWLQSVTDPAVALPTVSPRRLQPDYKASVAERQLVPLQLRSTDRVYILAVVSKSGRTLTANLRSPIIINASQRIGCQVVASDDLPLALPLAQSPMRSLRIAA